jgi:hypothetical protein
MTASFLTREGRHDARARALNSRVDRNQLNTYFYTPLGELEALRDEASLLCSALLTRRRCAVMGVFGSMPTLLVAGLATAPPNVSMRAVMDAVLTETSAEVFWMRASQLFSPHEVVMQHRVGVLFQEARRRQPAILFLDAMDVVLRMDGVCDALQHEMEGNERDGCAVSVVLSVAGPVKELHRRLVARFLQVVDVPVWDELV